MDPVHVVGQMPVSAEVLADAEGMREAFADALDPSPVARARFEARAQAAREQRVIDRHLSIPVVLTLDALLDRHGWSREYAEHYLQPYCSCGPDNDYGWSTCLHADDLGLRP